MTRDSDVDLLIIEESVSSRDEQWFQVQESLMELEYPFDIVIMARERFEETKGIIGGIAYPANNHGRVIYEAA